MRLKVIGVLLCILLCDVGVHGDGLSRRAKITTYGGWSWGIGGDFEKSTWYKKAGFTFGAALEYGVSGDMGVGVELMLQNYGDVVERYFLEKYAKNRIKANLLAHASLYPYVSEKGSISLQFGAGLYNFTHTGFGLNFGMAFSKMLSPGVRIVAEPRVHALLTDEYMYLPQLKVGLEFDLGRW